MVFLVWASISTRGVTDCFYDILWMLCFVCLCVCVCVCVCISAFGTSDRVLLYMCVRVSISCFDPADLILSQFVRLCVSILTVTGLTGLMAITIVQFEPSL